MFKIFRCCFFIFWFFSANNVLTQEIISTAQGLSNRWATSVVQDDEGLMWMGTINGLNRYDGYSVKQVFTPDITDNSIICLLKDNSGIIWIGTGNGLNRLNTKTGEIIKIFLPNKKARLKVSAIYQRNSGEIWLCDQDGVLYKVADNNTLQMMVELPLVNVKTTLLRSPVNYIKEDKFNRLWLISEWGYIFCYDGKKVETKSRHANDEDYPKTLHVLSKDLVLVGSQYSGLYYFDNKTGNKFTDPFLDSINSGSNKVYWSFEEKNGDLWIGNNLPRARVLRLRFTNGIPQKTEYSVPAGLNLTRGHQLYLSNEGLIWICTDMGVWKIKPRNSIFSNYFNSPGGPYSFRAMLQDNDGKYYLGSYNGFMVCDSHFNVLDKNLHTGNIKGAPYVRDMINETNRIWCATEDEGLLIYDKRKRSFSRPPSNLKPAAMPPADYFCLLKNGEEIWIGTANGLYAYNESEQIYLKIMPGVFDGIAVYQFIRISNNRILISTSSGLYVLKDGKTEQTYNANKLPSNEVNGAIEGENGKIYVATTNGFCAIDLNTRKVETYNVANGLCNNYINSLQKTPDGAIWISTNYGLSRFDIKSRTFTNFYQENGLAESEFNRWSATTDNNGNLLFGTVNGLSRFNPFNYSQPSLQTPRLFISGFSRHDSRKDSIFSSDYYSPDGSMSLSVKDNFIAFTLGLTSYGDAQNNRFYYRLSGIDDEWIPLGNQHHVRINSLPAGKYALELKGVNSEGTEAANTIQIDLKVMDVFYKSWWFILLLASVAVGVFYGIYRYRIQQFIKLQNMRTRIASDLHDEVGGLLTRISIQSELLEKDLEQEHADNINRIAENSRHAVDMMSDVLWSIDGRSDSVNKMVDRMHEHLSVLDDKQVKYEMKTNIPDIDRQVAGDKRQHIYLIFKEAVTNIIKHSNATEVEIRLEIKSDLVKLKIHDNGTNHVKNVHRGQGLHNMHMRSKKLKGELIVRQEEGNGFLIELNCVL